METMVALDSGEVWAEDAGEGIPVILLHPGWGDSAIWDEVAARLRFAARVIRSDTRGYGRSPAPAAPFRALDDLIGVLDHFGVERAIVVGHSSGGATAAGLALARPERVRSLLLVAPGIAGYPWPQGDRFGAECSRLVEDGDDEGLLELGLRTFAPADPGPAAQAQIRSAIRGMHAQYPFLQPDPDTFSRLEDLRAPTRLVLGDREYLMVADCGRAAAARIPGCELTIVPGADHMLPLRAPGLLADLITAELRRIRDADASVDADADAERTVCRVC
ncbi:MAG TPA: alpha/beta hydrolase [Actinocrinis sp.]|nr:alpha/beta hydrolase [Actinocrinis sp.]